jgi:hypothetical protein
MTNDESWDLLRAICNAANEDNFEDVKTITQNRLTTLQECHYDALLEAIDLTPDFITKEAEFLRKLRIALHDQQFGSLRTSLRAGLLETYLDDLDKKETTQPERETENVFVQSSTAGTNSRS